MDIRLDLMPHDAAGEEERAQLTQRLLAELRTLDIHKLQMCPDGSPPDRAKASDVVTVVLALSVPGGVLTSLVGLVQDWLGRQSLRHRVTVTADGDTVTVEDAAPEERRQLIEAFVRRHGAGEE